MAVTRTIPTRRRAIAMLERGDRAVHGLIDPLTAAQRDRHGVGGGEWSPIDLLGHLASWERHGLDALAAWRDGRRAPIDVALARRGVAGVNADTLAAASALSSAEVRDAARSTHMSLVAAIADLTDDVWVRAPLTSGRPLGFRLGSILGGPTGPFRHVDAHLADLQAFVGTLPVS